MNCQDVPAPVKVRPGKQNLKTMAGFLKVHIESIHISLRRLTKKVEELEAEIEREANKSQD